MKKDLGEQAGPDEKRLTKINTNCANHLCHPFLFTVVKLECACISRELIVATD